MRFGSKAEMEHTYACVAPASIDIVLQVSKPVLHVLTLKHHLGLANVRAVTQVRPVHRQEVHDSIVQLLINGEIQLSNAPDRYRQGTQKHDMAEEVVHQIEGNCGIARLPCDIEEKVSEMLHKHVANQRRQPQVELFDLCCQHRMLQPTLPGAQAAEAPGEVVGSHLQLPAFPADEQTAQRKVGPLRSQQHCVRHDGHRNSLQYAVQLTQPAPGEAMSQDNCQKESSNCRGVKDRKVEEVSPAPQDDPTQPPSAEVRRP
mmetsp:Transcript_3798/g.8864  ORF Transcript_3798/g.8864 Transcript_3798/m.8864 type:complete len:259 (-) Transcript_3798:1074-1850(-)